VRKKDDSNTDQKHFMGRIKDGGFIRGRYDRIVFKDNIKSFGESLEHAINKKVSKGASS